MKRLVLLVALLSIVGCTRPQPANTLGEGYSMNAPGPSTCPMAIGRVGNDFAQSLGLTHGQCVDAHNKPIAEECCTRPWQPTVAHNECEGIGYNAVEDYCYDGGIGGLPGDARRHVDGPCCNKMRSAINATRATAASARDQ